MWRALPRQRQSALLVAGGRGSGGIWTMTGLGEQRMLQNGHFREALRLRLCQQSAPAGTVCQLPRDSANGDENNICGECMDSDGRLVHPLTCDHVAARLRPHRALCKALGRACRAQGAAIDYERRIPHLYRWDEDMQRYQQAVLDVVITWPGACPLKTVDATIACPLAERAANSWKKPGAARSPASHLRKLWAHWPT